MTRVTRGSVFGDPHPNPWEPEPVNPWVFCNGCPGVDGLYSEIYYDSVDCPRSGPGRPSANFAGPGPGPRGPGQPQLALARGQLGPGQTGQVRVGPGPCLALIIKEKKNQI